MTKILQNVQVFAQPRRCRRRQSYDNTSSFSSKTAELKTILFWNDYIQVHVLLFYCLQRVGPVEGYQMFGSNHPNFMDFWRDKRSIIIIWNLSFLHIKLNKHHSFTLKVCQIPINTILQSKLFMKWQKSFSMHKDILKLVELIEETCQSLK